MFSNCFSENHAVYEVTSENTVELETLQMTIWRHVACWISKATRAQTHAFTRSFAPTPTPTFTLTNTPARMNKHAIAQAHRNM